MDKMPAGLVNRKDVEDGIPIQEPTLEFIICYDKLGGNITSVEIFLGDDFQGMSPAEQRKNLKQYLQEAIDDEDFLSYEFDEKLVKERFMRQK